MIPTLSLTHVLSQWIVAEFEAAFDKVAVVGDTVEPGNIADATHSGLNKAFVF